MRKSNNIQKFQGSTLYTKTTVNNIIAIYEQCEAPTNWYCDANLFAQKLANRTGYSLEKVCGVIAALSPLKSWDENKNIAKLFLNGGRCKHTKIMKQKAMDILSGSGNPDDICKILNGNKITAFFINMLYPERADNVTIDRHAISIAIGRSVTQKENFTTDNQYLFFERCYKIAAAKVGVNPNFMQSATWEKWREFKNAQKFEEVPF